MDNPAALITLARRLCFSGEINAAKSCIEALGSVARPAGPLLAAVAHLYWLIGDIASAHAYISRARAAGVDTPDELHLHAMLCHFRGEADQARRILESCLERWPLFGGAAQALANLRRYCRGDDHAALYKARLAQLPDDSADRTHAVTRAQFLSALAKELDDLGDTAGSWSALTQSKAIMRALNPYDARAETGFTDLLLASEAALPAVSSRSPRASDDQGPMPIFVVGMPRSGSTLLDRILSSHPEVASAGEINDLLRQLHWTANVPPSGVAGMREVLRRLPELDLQELGQRYLAQTRWRAGGCRYFVDKLPINIQLVPLIRRALPHAPILHITREPMDVCFSNFRAMFGDVTPWSNDLNSVAHFHGEYRRIVSQWHARYPGVMLDVDYRVLVDNPEGAIRAVLKHCNLPYDPRCLHPEKNTAPVATPSAAQVREPVHKRGLSTWQRYKTQLEPLRDALGEG